MLRATRQSVDALITGSGFARVTRQYVDVLIDPTLLYGDAADVLEFVDGAEAVLIHAVTQDVGLSDSIAFTHIWVRPVEDDLGLIETLDVRGPIYVTINHNLGLDHLPAGHLAVQNVSAESVIWFQYKAARVQTAFVENTVTFSDVVYRLHPSADVLSLTQEALVGKGKSAENELIFTQVVIPGAVFRRSVTNDLALLQSGTYQLIGPCTLKQYDPFIGFGAVITEPTPTLGLATFTLTYPYVDPTTTLVLRSPAFGDRDQIGFTRINRQTRGGTLIVFADSIWPKTQTLQVEVSGLRQAQADDFLAFVGESLGKEIGLLDHENRQWRGLIMDPDTPIANPERGEYTISFQFEGELC